MRKSQRKSEIMKQTSRVHMGSTLNSPRAGLVRLKRPFSTSCSRLGPAFWLFSLKYLPNTWGGQNVGFPACAWRREPGLCNHSGLSAEPGAVCRPGACHVTLAQGSAKPVAPRRVQGNAGSHCPQLRSRGALSVPHGSLVSILAGERGPALDPRLAALQRLRLQ